MHSVRVFASCSAGVAIVLASTGGCADRSAPVGQPASSTPPPATATPGPNDAGARALPTPAPPPAWDRLSRLAAADAATRVVRTFARPGMPAQRWFRDLSPLLSPAAAQDFAGTDPARVPAHGVTGAASLLPSSSGYIARVAVPSDVGRYTVTLSRQQQSGPWLAERLQPPPGTGP